VLIRSPNHRQVLTTVVTMDPERALFQAVADYLATMQYVGQDGRAVSFSYVAAGQVDLETDFQFPLVAVSGSGDATDEANGLGMAYNGSTERIQDSLTGKNYLLLKASELAVSLTVEAFANDPVERSLMQQGMRDLFNPVDWMAGFRMKIPYYHGVFASFLVTSSRKNDSPEDAQRRIFSCTFTIRATIPVLRLMGPFAPLNTRIKLDVEG
jgi:hypothetical protein